MGKEDGTKEAGRRGGYAKTVQSKLCVKCNRVLPLGEFYPNSKWKAQMYRDAWCKECAMKHCKDKETLREYCIENNRTWEDSYYDTAMKKALYGLATNPEYISPKTSKKRKDALAGEAAARQFFS